MAGASAGVRGAEDSAAGSMDRSRGGGTSPRPRVLLLIPSYAKTEIEAQVAADEHPVMDYHALQTELGADLADYRAMENDRHPLVRVARSAGKDAALAMHGFIRRDKYDAIFSNGENVGIPLAALFKGLRRRPGHTLIGHKLSTPKKRRLLRATHRQMDAIFVYAATQREYARSLGIPYEKLRLIPFHADHRFFRPVEHETRNMICSAGLEWRDYPTLVEAVRDLDVDVRLAAASPWSKHGNELNGRALPANVDARPYDYAGLRTLYAESRLVVVPLYNNDFQAGVTTILEAMSMGKAVIVSSTDGQGDVIEDGANGIYVSPGDSVALRAAIVRLLGDPNEARRIGENARRTIEDRMTLDHWVDRIAQGIRAAARPAVRTLSTDAVSGRAE